MYYGCLSGVSDNGELVFAEPIHEPDFLDLESVAQADHVVNALFGHSSGNFVGAAQRA
jgi:hypothetical protein